MLEENIGDFMKAVLLTETCEASQLHVSDVAKPEVKNGWVLVEVLGFGINRSELILREYEADENYINLPVIPGIECYGVVVDKSDCCLDVGDHVVALMGGMGRSFDGSYAEYALLPESNVFKIDEKLAEKYSVEEISALPETFFTAYCSLFDSLELNSRDVILIRGGSSTVGIAAIQLASRSGATVIATTRSRDRLKYLSMYGASYALIDDDNLITNILSLAPEGVSKVLELVGPLTMKESFKALQKHGTLCITGILGGQETIEKFDPIIDIPNDKYLTSFYSNYPTQEKMNEIFRYVYRNDIRPIIADKYTLEEIGKAHSVTENNKKLGKIIVINNKE